jgi:hypothetical protein
MKNLERAYRLIQWWPHIVEQAQLVRGGAAFEMPVRASSLFRQLKV